MSRAGNKMLRHATTDLGGLTQWLGRKMKNHNPPQQMKERPKSKKYEQPAIGAIVMEDRGQVYYCLNGRAFQVDVTEVEMHVVPDNLKAIGR